MKNITAIVSAKGGTGKSTVASIMSFLLARKDKKILIIDLNSGFRTLDFIFGVSKDLFFDISDVVSGKCDLKDAIIKCDENLYLIPSPMEIEQRLSKAAFAWILDFAKCNFDHIIIDCSSGINDDVLSAISLSNRAIIVTTADPICVKCSEIFASKIDKINPNIKKRMIINKFFKEVFLRAKFFRSLDEIIDKTGVQLLGIVPESEMIYINFSKGTPCIEKSKTLFAFKEINTRFEKI